MLWSAYDLLLECTSSWIMQKFFMESHFDFGLFLCLKYVTAPHTALATRTGNYECQISLARFGQNQSQFCIHWIIDWNIFAFFTFFKTIFIASSSGSKSWWLLKTQFNKWRTTGANLSSVWCNSRERLHPMTTNNIIVRASYGMKYETSQNG